LICQSALKTGEAVVFFHNGIGDYLINLPMLRGLAKIFANRMTLVCTNDARKLFLKDLQVKGRIETEMTVSPEDRQCSFDAEAVASRIDDCAIFISAVPWISESLLSLKKIISPDFSIGFFNAYTASLPLNYGKHSADLAFDLVRYFNPHYKLEDFVAPPSFPEAVMALVNKSIASLPSGARILVIHADTASDKMWITERYIEALDVFLAHNPDFIALLIGKNAQPITSHMHPERVISCYGLSLMQSCCYVSKADIFLGVDSCMLHVADFCRVPSVGLYGATQAKEFGFLVGPNVTIQAEKNMAEIETHQVVTALGSILAGDIPL
jgi:ADP-heptose:LPS heptosyltransferase